MHGAGLNTHGFMWYSDLQGYYHLVQGFPQLYLTKEWEYTPLVYMPYFYLIFYLPSFIPLQVLFDAAFIYNSIACALILYMVRKAMSRTCQIVMLAALLVSAIAIGDAANIEILVLFVDIFIYYKMVQGKYRSWMALLYSIFLFKIYSISFIVLYLGRMNKKQRVDLFIIIVVSQIVLNIPFLFLNTQLLNTNYIYSIITYPNPPAGLSSVWFNRITAYYAVIVSLVEKLGSRRGIRRFNHCLL
jgi:hypothetical protein